MASETEIERNNQDVQILRVYELRLLRCTLSLPSHTNSQPEPIDSLHIHLHHILFFLETGDYVGALSSDAARIVLGSSSTFHSIESAEGFYSELIDRVESFMLNEPEDEYASACRVILVMCVAVAALFGFTQWNMTGPPDDLSRCPLPLENVDNIQFVEWENWARNQLISAGSDLIGKFSNCQYLVLAKKLLMRMRDFLFEGSLSSTYGIRSISWWLARLLLIQQRILDERSSSLFDLLQVTMGETLHHFGTFKKVHGYWGMELHDGEASAIASVVHLEAGINNYIYGRVDSCRKHFESAEEAAGIQLSVTGALGFRTVHQVDPKAQRVLITKRVPLNGADTTPAVITDIQTHDYTVDKNNSHHLQNETDETCDIYMTPKLLEKGSESEINIQGIQNAGHAAAPLTEIQQAVILAHCLLIEKSSRQDELQRWDMAPYIEAIDSQQSSYFTLRSFCDILRIRWELTRSRTKWRALELMEKLVKGVQGPSPGVAERIPFIYSVYLPVVPALQKEYGETLVSCGLIGEAITVFEGLELWDNLIYCNCLLGKKSAAVELIKTRLSEMPNDPRLWCSLGDVTNNDACYEKALEVSNNRSARAMRSLARSAYDRGDYEKSKLLWESAMALNSLYSNGWFALGAASLKARDVEKALDAFTRAVQLDPENGEAWNNIACLHMIKKRNKEAFIAFKEALKFKRDSWQLWENYSHVAMDVGNIGQALEGVQMILNMTGNKRIDTELLEKITLEMEKRSVNRHYVSSAPTNDLNGCSQGPLVDPHVDSGNESVNVEFAVGSSRETENLLEFLGKVLQQIVKNTSTADIWGLYARWYKTRGDLTMYSEALLKQVRSYQGSDLWNDGGRFKRYARASLELCKAYMEISSSTGSPRELSTAQMHLKNIIKQADNFSNTQEFRDIQACLEEVKMKLQSG